VVRHFRAQLTDEGASGAMHRNHDLGGECLQLRDSVLDIRAEFPPAEAVRRLAGCGKSRFCS
jgi:hypothetical protein